MLFDWGFVSSLLGGVLPSAADGRPLVAVPLDFEAVYTANFAFIWRSVRGLGVPLAQADDVTQEVFVIAYRKLDTLKQQGAVRAWLFGIARRVAKDFRRAKGRRGPTVEFEDARSSSNTPSPEQGHARRRDLEIVRDYVARLDDERRALFFLSMVEGLPLSEVAETLALNPNTTYSRVRTMRKELAARLLAEGEGTDGPY